MIDRAALSKSGIYMLRNEVNGKVYIGQSVNIYRRYAEHLKLLRKNKHYNGRLQGSWNTHGEEAFSIHVLACANGLLDDLEREQIAKHKSTNDAFGYNIAIEPGNAFRSGMKNSPSHRAAISKAKKGKPGHKHTEQSRAAIRDALSGKAKSEEHRKKLSESLKGNQPPNLGVPHSDTTKQRMKEAKASIVWDGEMMSLATISKIVGIERATLSHRMKKLGMTLQQAIETPLRPRSDRKTAVQAAA